MQNKDKINTPGTEYTNAAKPGTVVALGMFDGMHVGHKKIIDATVLIARQSGLVPAVFTFKNHPQELFGKKILRLCSNETRAALMRRQGIELVDEVSLQVRFATFPQRVYPNACRKIEPKDYCCRV